MLLSNCRSAFASQPPGRGGSFLLASKLKAIVSCGPIFEDIFQNYKFGDDGSVDIDVDTEPEENLEKASA